MRQEKYRLATPEEFLATQSRLRGDMNHTNLMPRGGKREGAGRKTIDPTGDKRKTQFISCTDEELAAVKKFLTELREGKPPNAKTPPPARED